MHQLVPLQPSHGSCLEGWGLGGEGHRPLIQLLERLATTTGYPKGFRNHDFLLHLLGEAVSGPQWEKGTEQAATLPSCLILGLHHLEMGKRNVYVALHLFHIIHQCW